MTDREGRVTKEGDVRDGPARAEAPRETTAGTADGLIVAEHTVADGERAGVIHDGAAEAGTSERGAGPRRPALGQVVEEGAVTDGGGGRRARGPDRHDGPAESRAAGAARVAVTPDGPV